MVSESIDVSVWCTGAEAAECFVVGDESLASRRGV